jgi:tRNA1(Val) A37 N6-methylase TrmN6
MLNLNGSLAVILPYETADHFINIARKQGLFIHEKLSIHPFSDKTAIRCILAFGTYEIDNVHQTSLTIKKINDSFTREYMNLTKAFHPFFPD